MGAFPNLSRYVLFCPRSSFVLFGARNWDTSRQRRTNGDKTGHLGTICLDPTPHSSPQLYEMCCLAVELRFAVALLFAKQNGQFVSRSLRKMLAISLSIQDLPSIVVAMPWCTQVQCEYWTRRVHKPVTSRCVFLVAFTMSFSLALRALGGRSPTTIMKSGYAGGMAILTRKSSS